MMPKLIHMLSWVACTPWCGAPELALAPDRANELQTKNAKESRGGGQRSELIKPNLPFLYFQSLFQSLLFCRDHHLHLSLLEEVTILPLVPDAL